MTRLIVAVRSTPSSIPVLAGSCGPVESSTTGDDSGATLAPTASDWISPVVAPPVGVAPPPHAARANTIAAAAVIRDPAILVMRPSLADPTTRGASMARQTQDSDLARVDDVLELAPQDRDEQRRAGKAKPQRGRDPERPREEPAKRP